jgi:phage tail-like protein
VNPVPAFGFSVFLMPPPSAFDPIESLADTATAGAGGLAQTTIAIGFTEVSGLDGSMDVETFHEGGGNFAPRRFMTPGKFPSIVCRRGITASTDLALWYRQVQLEVTPPQRRNGFVVLHANSGPGGAPVGNGAKPLAAWFFQRALPDKLEGPRLNAKVNEIAIETLELAHEGLVRLKNSEIGIGAGSIPGVVGS